MNIEKLETIKIQKQLNQVWLLLETHCKIVGKYDLDGIKKVLFKYVQNIVDQIYRKQKNSLMTVPIH